MELINTFADIENTLRRDARRASEDIYENGNKCVHGSPDVCGNPGDNDQTNVNNQTDACHASLQTDDDIGARPASWNFVQNVYHQPYAYDKQDACHASLQTDDGIGARPASRDFDQSVNDQPHAYDEQDACHASLREIEKYRNLYRVESARASWWDYSNDGFYFITICTENHRIYFGDVINGEVQLSEMGHLVQQQLSESFNIRDELIHHASVIMPNHIHLIIEIDGRETRRAPEGINENIHDQPETRGVAYRAPKSVSSFVAGFKSSVTGRMKHSKSIWQMRFYDHIIRDQKEYNLIHDYIQKNPHMWNSDRFYIEGE